MRLEAMTIAHQIHKYHHKSVDFSSCLKAAWNIVKSGKVFLAGSCKVVEREDILSQREMGAVEALKKSFPGMLISSSPKIEDGWKMRIFYIGIFEIGTVMENFDQDNQFLIEKVQRTVDYWGKQTPQDLRVFGRYSSHHTVV